MSKASVSVRVRFFAVLREAVGAPEVEQRLPEGSTLQDLLDRLVETYPALHPHLGAVRFAVNRQYAGPETLLHAGDEVALLAPVGGG